MWPTLAVTACLLAALIIALVGWACCAAGGQADDEAGIPRG